MTREIYSLKNDKLPLEMLGWIVEEESYTNVLGALVIDILRPFPICLHLRAKLHSQRRFKEMKSTTSQNLQYDETDSTTSRKLARASHYRSMVTVSLRARRTRQGPVHGEPRFELGWEYKFWKLRFLSF